MRFAFKPLRASLAVLGALLGAASILLPVTIITPTAHADTGIPTPPPNSDPALQATQNSQLLKSLIADIETADKLADPVMAGIHGDREALRRLEDVSLKAAKLQDTQREAFLKRYAAILPDGLSDQERLNHALIGYVLKRRQLISKIDSARIPFISDSGFYSGLTYITRQTQFETAQDYDAYIERLSKVPAFFEQHKENMRRGIEGGFTMPASVMPSVIASLENLAAIDSARHPLATPFKDINTRIDEETAKQINQKGLAAMEEHVMPAYRQMLGFMETEYQPKARTTIGLSDAPDGKAYYEAFVKFYTTLDLSPDAVHRIGLDEVARIRAEMDTIIESSGFEGDFAAFLEFLRNDPQFYASSREDLLKEAAWIAKRADGKMPEYFGTLPRLSYGVIPVPSELEKNYTTGRYFNGNLAQGKAGNYVVNTYDLKSRPLYNLPALTLHEGVPGHHHQISLGSELENVPQFRQNLYPHAYGEGWALYAEKLGVEMGLYQTPYEHFGRLTYEMWRACRLVIDTGIHYKGWSREQAEHCLFENTALSAHNIKTEIDRYIAWPGQALAYKIGELKIVELRKRAEDTLGPKFSIRAFHDAILTDGAMPLAILEAKINDWIEQQRAAQKTQGQ